ASGSARRGRARSPAARSGLTCRAPAAFGRVARDVLRSLGVGLLAARDGCKDDESERQGWVHATQVRPHSSGSERDTRIVAGVDVWRARLRSPATARSGPPGPALTSARA